MTAAAYKRALTAKTVLGIAATPSLAYYSIFVAADDDLLRIIIIYSIYFVVESFWDGAMDFIWRPARPNLEGITIAHHVVGVAAMYFTPPIEVCLTSWRLIWCAEFSTPLLYLTNHYRFVQRREAPWGLSAAMLIAWPCFRQGRLYRVFSRILEF